MVEASNEKGMGRTGGIIELVLAGGNRNVSGLCSGGKGWMKVLVCGSGRYRFEVFPDEFAWGPEHRRCRSHILNMIAGRRPLISRSDDR